MAAKQREWFQQPELREEVFGPTTTLISLNDLSELDNLPARGALAISVWFDPGDARDLDVVGALMNRHASAGRLIFNGPPTGVRVATSMVHGGPFPATNAPMGGTTAVGPRAIERWCRPICFQNCPDALLPPELQNANPRRIWRTLNGQPTQSPIP
jgi:NADP-dependent aldehyde dehydrogenase